VCNFTYQEDVRNYPAKLIDSLMSSQKKFSLKSRSNVSDEFLCDDDDDGFNDIGSFRGPVIKTNTYNLDSRFGNTASKEAPATLDDDSLEPSEPLCDAVQRKIFPQTLHNVLNKVVVVVNHGKFRQEVSIETCR
jgi:hypothetical protein